MISKDILWKGIIEDLAEEFVRYFFSDFVHLIDFEKRFAFLDKELEQLSPQSVSNRRHADKLMRSWLRDGEEQWFLIHVEIQGYPDTKFAERMFQYAYRIKDRYGCRLTALAIYTDTSKKHHYSEYRESFFGSEIMYRFRKFALTSYAPGVLLKADNIFGLVLEVARQELVLQKRSDEERLDLKTELVRFLFAKKVAKEKIRKILTFIGYYIGFDKEEFFHKFEENIQSIVKSRKAMGIEEAILHEVEQRGRAKGFAEGKEEGKEEGREEATEEKERVFVTRCWEQGMSPEDIAYLADMPLEKVEEIIRDLGSGTE